MRTILEAVKSAHGDYRVIALYGLCLISGLILFKGKRKRFVIPAAIVTVAILTPPFYGIWEGLNEAMVYWRALWMIPVLPICAAAVAMMVEKSRSIWLKIAAVCLSISVFVLFGSYVYTNAYSPDAFYSTTNAEKLPADVVDVGEALLELEDHPRVVADSTLSVYLRQYSGRIQSPYARSVIQGTTSQVGIEIFTDLTIGDYISLAHVMADNNYDLLATNNEYENIRIYLEKAGFELLRQVNRYGIYRLHSQSTELRTYNELGQVTSITYVDEKGDPVNGSDGYATVFYEYDDHGYVSYEFHRDVNGDGVLDKAGKAGYRRELNHLGQVVRETYLDESGNPVVIGFATRTCEYNRRHCKIKESYFDENDRPMLRTDNLYASRTISYVGDTKTVAGERYFGLNGEPALNKNGYASYTREVDENGWTVRECYWGINGEPILRNTGYAEVRREYDESGHVTKESYWDTLGAQIKISKGYSAWSREYDAAGNITMECYFNPDGSEALLQNGYSRVDRQFDGSGHWILEAYSANGEAVYVPNGYAAVTRVYDDGGNIIREAYRDGNAQPIRIKAGYAALTREYDALGQIVAEAYWDEEDRPIARTEGYASLKRAYDDKGLVIREAYYNEQGQPAAVKGGYDEVDREYNAQKLVTREAYLADGEPVLRTDTGIAGLTREYDAHNRLVRESYFGIEQELVNHSGGYAEFRNEYTSDGALSLSYYYNVKGNLLQRGSSYLHEYLRGLLEEDVTVFIAAKDEASNAITVTLAEDLKALGIQSDIRGKYRYSFCAVASKGSTNGQEALSGAEPVHLDGVVDGKAYSISSAGYTVGNQSSITIDGVDYSPNVRGLNIVVFKDGEVVDAVGFDTNAQNMGVTR